MKARFVLLFLFSLSGVESAHSKVPVGGTFVINIGAEPTTLHPIRATDGYSSQVHAYTLEGLLDRNPDTYEWEPALADKWEISKDGKAFTFHLRKGALFHNGKPVTVEDIKFSFDAIFDPKMNAAVQIPYYQGIKEVKIIDSETVQFIAKEKYFKNFDVAAGLTIIPKHIYGGENGAKINHKLIGSGPYVLSKYEKGKRIILKRNQDWWGFKEKTGRTVGMYNFDRMVLRFVSESSVSFEMLKKGDLDFMGFTPEDYTQKAVGSEWGKKVFKVKTHNKAPKSYGFIAFNLRRPLFQDQKVRVALSMLINRRLMIEKFLFGMSEPATGPWHRESEYTPSDVKPIEFDPKEALRLLREDGWSDSDRDGVLDKVISGSRMPLRFTLLNPSKDFEKYLTVFKEDAKKAGVDIILKYVEWNTFVKVRNEGNFDTAAMAWGGGSVDLDPKQIWHSESASKGGSNFIDYKNPEVDQLIDEARGTLEKSKRTPLLKKVFRIIAADAPYIFLFNSKAILYGHTKKIEKKIPTRTYSIGQEYWWDASLK